MAVGMAEYWLVHNPDKGFPKVVHYSHESAKREAERLAAQHPGEKFVILRSRSYAMVEPAPVVWGKTSRAEPF